MILYILSHGDDIIIFRFYLCLPISNISHLIIYSTQYTWGDTKSSFFFVLDSCGQKCHLAPTAWDGRALKLSVRGRSSVNLTLGDTLWTSKRVLRVTSTLSKRVTSSHPPKSSPVLYIAGDNSNFVISVPRLPVQYPSRLFPKRQET